MAPQIVVDGLSKQYRIGKLERDTTLRDKLVRMLKHPFGSRDANTETLWALKDVSFSVDPGEVVGIIGRNGAGKSTLLKLLSRITYPTAGRVSVRGRIAALLEVGTGFHDELTGRENIYLNGSILGMGKAEVDKKFDEIVAFSGVERFLETPIKRYSSGMRLRLGFAVAAHLDPEVLIVDEVLAVGDAAFQKKCLDTMQDMRGGGRTVLFVSHNMAAVENLCTRAIWIDGGEVRMDGTTRGAIDAYLSASAGARETARDLAEWESRRGDGEVQYTRIEFLGPGGEPKSLIRCGDALTLRFHYRAAEPVSRPSFGFKILTELGTVVTDISTWLHGVEIPWLPAGEGYIDLEIDALNLLPARYHLSLSITGPDRKVYDALAHCAVIEIEISDIYGSGRVIGSRFGILYVPQRWRFNGSHVTKHSDLSDLSSQAVAGGV
ncbi:MAG: ATP-binding cassette domain-containing protein [Luteitalea sp.]|nr:ATP-binding cassette domain-containing protein [Luteitalea sp.]